MPNKKSNPALKAAPSGRWTLRDKALRSQPFPAQRHSLVATKGTHNLRTLYRLPRASTTAGPLFARALTPCSQPRMSIERTPLPFVL